MKLLFPKEYLRYLKSRGWEGIDPSEICTGEAKRDENGDGKPRRPMVQS